MLLLAACSSTNGPSVPTVSSGSAAPSPSADKAEANRRFAKCMREHGVDMPDPGPDGNLQFTGGDGDRTKMVAAAQACQQFLPNGGALSSLSPEQQAQALAFAKCMREHGINMSDPDPNGGAGAMIKGGDIDFDSPAFQAAAEACKGVAGR